MIFDNLLTYREASPVPEVLFPSVQALKKDEHLLIVFR